MKKEYQELKTPMGMLYVVDERDEVEIYDSDKKFMDFINDNFYKAITTYQNLTNAEDLVKAGIFPNAMWNVNKEELMIRLTGRRVCKTCGASFHVVNIPPKKEGICDVCGAELVQRADDNEETAANRIEVYNNETKPLVDYYEKAGNIAHIDGTIGLENVFNAIVEVVGE